MDISYWDTRSLRQLLRGLHTALAKPTKKAIAIRWSLLRRFGTTRSTTPGTLPGHRIRASSKFFDASTVGVVRHALQAARPVGTTAEIVFPRNPNVVGRCSGVGGEPPESEKSAFWLRLGSPVSLSARSDSLSSSPRLDQHREALRAGQVRGSARPPTRGQPP